MTTAKQEAANKANAKKSTGPKTPEGKAVVAMNAISHGILSNRLFLTDESPDDFAALQDDLRKSLKPMGMLELALVEKIAVALWKQRRLVAAETASIEMARLMSRPSNRDAIEKALGIWSSNPVTKAELEPVSQEDLTQQKWCSKVLAEFEALDDAVLDTSNLEALAKDAPLMFRQFKDEAEEDSGEGDSMTVEAYLGILDDGLRGWANDLQDWCEKELEKQGRRSVVQSIAKLVQVERSAPITNELMIRYQVALDGELYRGIEALRKQQEWRIRAGIEVEADVVETA